MTFTTFFTVTTGARSDTTLIVSQIDHYMNYHSIKSRFLTREIIQMIAKDAERYETLASLEFLEFHANKQEWEFYENLPDELKLLAGEFESIQVCKGTVMAGKYEKIVFFEQ